MFKKLAAPIVIPFLVLSVAARYSQGCSDGGTTTGTGGKSGTGGAKGTGGTPVTGTGGMIKGTGGATDAGAGTGGAPTDGATGDTATGTGGSGDAAAGTGGSGDAAAGTGGSGDAAATDGAPTDGSSLITYNVPLTPEMEGITDGGSSGHGMATVTLNPTTGAVTVTGTFTGLTGPATLAHIHGLAAPGSNASPIVTLSFVNAGADGGVDAGVGSGTFGGSGTLTTTGVDGGQSQVAGMMAGLTYLNVHTTMFGAGEIRGQIH